MLYVIAGLIIGPDVLGLLQIGLEDKSVVLLAELTLAVLLFSDAARIDTATLRESLSLPTRLLTIGLPLTILLGTLVTALFLPGISLVEAALIAAVLSPTDAALGQAVVSDKRVPVRIRQSLNVESGLNDGLIVPVVAVLILLEEGEGISAGELISEVAIEIGLGVAIGASIGLFMGRLVPWIENQPWMDLEDLRLVAIGGSLAAFSGVTLIGGNGFITAFVCGLALRHTMGERAAKHTELAEDAGQIGASATFVLFGALLVVPGFQFFSLPVAICAILTLTVVRMLPVRLSMLGTGLALPTVAFLGWFGPRGLASMLFGLLLVAERGGESEELFAVVTIVIVASVFLHGMSSAPGAAAYSRWFEKHGDPEMAEAGEMAETPVRWRGRIGWAPRGYSNQ